MLQAGFAAAAVAAVWVSDRIGTGMAVAVAGIGGVRWQTAILLAGRIVGGWALGMAFRLQFARAVEPDPQLRRLLVTPAAIVCMWFVALPFLPAGAVAALPAWATAEGASGVVGFIAVLLGLAWSLAVIRRA